MALVTCIALMFLPLFMTTAMASFLSNDHIVGGAAGWTTGFDYKKWASAQTFYVRDVLLFESEKKGDKVLEVREADFESCKSSSPLVTHAAGSNTMITLTRPGPYYFITRSRGNCRKGQKLEIQVNSTPTPPSDDKVPPAGLSFPMSPGADMDISVALLGFMLVFCIFIFVGPYILTPALIGLLVVFILLIFANVIVH